MPLEKYEHSARNMEESFGLAPTALISLYEIYHIHGRQDVDNWANREYALRFCSADNLSKLSGNSLGVVQRKGLKWAGYEYIPIGIQSNSFATASTGLPRPTLIISNRGIGEDISNSSKIMYPVFQSISQYNLYYNDLNNARVIRRRVFAKFLDGENFPDNNNQNPWGTRGTTSSGSDITSGGEVIGNKSEIFEFSRELYFISKKTNETKEKIEYELTSSIDVENVTIPNRTILSNHCSWCYRGEGCSYSGPPAATDLDDENFMLSASDGYDDSSNSGLTKLNAQRTTNQRRVNRAAYSDEIGEEDWSLRAQEWSPNRQFVKGDVVKTPSASNQRGFTDGTKTTKLNSNGELVVKNDLTLWVCIVDHESSPNNAPESKSGNWVADQCSKTINGCKIRFQNSRGYTKSNSLRFGGFPATFDFDTSDQ